MQFLTRNLTLAEKREICHRAYHKCFNWWADILDCSESFHRKQIDMSFEEIMEKLDDNAHFSIIHRTFDDDYLEVGFSTMKTPSYFLWMELDPEFIPEFTEGLKPSGSST